MGEGFVVPCAQNIYVSPFVTAGRRRRSKGSGNPIGCAITANGRMKWVKTKTKNRLRITQNRAAEM
jgi:hypothetical protein